MVDHGNSVPDHLQVLEVRLAVSQVLVFGLFQFEELLETVEVGGFLLDLAQFHVIFVNQGIGHVNYFEGVLAGSVVERQGAVEEGSEFLHFLLEFDQLLLDIGGFLGLER